MRATASRCCGGDKLESDVILLFYNKRFDKFCIYFSVSLSDR